jgi:hypothetical protein
MLSLSEQHVTIANHGISRFLDSLAHFLAHLLHLFREELPGAKVARALGKRHGGLV